MSWKGSHTSNDADTVMIDTDKNRFVEIPINGVERIYKVQQALWMQP